MSRAARRWRQPPGGEWTFWAVLLILVGFVMIGMTVFRSRPSALAALLAAPTLVSGIAVWFRASWARTAGVTTMAGYMALLAASMAIGGVTTWRAVIVACGCYSAWSMWRDLSVLPPDEADDKPLISFVLLLSEPRYLEAPILGKIVSAAWGGNYRGIQSESELDEETDAEGDPSRFVVGNSPLFLVKSPDAMFAVNNFDAPYYDVTEESLAAVKDLRIRRALDDHKAWLSVDLLSGHDPGRDRRSYYPQIAKLIAELAGPDCLAIYHPESSRINAWDPGLEETLRSPRALEDFASPGLVPVWDVDGHSPAMKAAVAEARRRFPEFVDAFNRKDGENFTVKAPVTRDDRTEYIWIHVDGLEPEYIHGLLGNEPLDLGELKLGDRVEVKVEDLNDWLYLKDGNWVGLFTKDAMTRGG
ncbi:MAG TPA: DUF2314 domain-containing protein [Planctomycetota bacterium]|nr:DUF2314 domain-containing protein [Planctomycetota bacterium]